MHKEFTTLMSTVLDREATAAETERLHEHLAVCPVCAQTWMHWRTLDRYLAAAPLLMPAQGFVWRVAERLERERQRARQRRWVGSSLLLAWAGIIAVLWLCLIGGVVWAFTHPVEVGQVASAGAYLLNGLAWLLRTMRSILLADGGGLGLSLGVGFYLGVTALVLLLWAWLLLRAMGWLRPLATAGDSFTYSLKGWEVISC